MRFLADVTVILHAGFIVFVILGGLLLLWRRALIYLHLPALTWAVLLECNSWMCPLTYVENYFRNRADLDTYEVGFVDQYIVPVIYPATLTPDMQMLIAVTLLVINCAIYGLVVRKFWISRGTANRVI